jgi:hypothetical protein
MSIRYNMPDNRKTSTWHAEYSMGSLDYQRMNEILISCDNLSVSVMMNMTEAILPFYASCRAFYHIIKPIMIKTKREKFDKEFEEIRASLKLDVKGMSEELYKGKAMNVPPALFDRMRRIYEELLEIKQIHGLGFPVKREKSEKEKLKGVFK